MILTRFSRVTFNAAHKYLGLTSEVLRTEKAINDIACHPLPASFYETGGLQYLRQRFDGGSSRSSDEGTGYFSFTHSSPSTMSKTKSGDSVATFTAKSKAPSKTNVLDVPLTSSPSTTTQPSPFSRSSRNQVQAGDLLIPSGHTNESYRPLNRSYSILSTPRLPKFSDKDSSDDSHQSPRGLGLTVDDFDLREEVMSCIAKSIGLLQPPLSGSDSVEASPAAPPTEIRRSSETFSSPFGSLSLLDVGDDSSSITAGSITSSGGYMSGLDNEVEILFFAAGSTLAKAGELNTGKLISDPRLNLLTWAQRAILRRRRVS